MQTLLICSDSHGQLDPRIAKLSQSCDVAIHAGDIIGENGFVGLRPKSSKVYAVRGNNDFAGGWPQQQQTTLEAIPELCELKLVGGKLMIVHGHRQWHKQDYFDNLRRDFPDVRAIICGHSHHQIIDQSTNPWIINPGASGQVRNHGGPACIVMIIDQQSWTFKPVRFQLEAA